MIAERDLLEEAGRIDREATMLLTTSAHLHAVIQLVREAKAIIEGSDEVNVHDWRREAAKVVGS